MSVSWNHDTAAEWGRGWERNIDRGRGRCRGIRRIGTRRTGNLKFFASGSRSSILDIADCGVLEGVCEMDGKTRAGSPWFAIAERFGLSFEMAFETM